MSASLDPDLISPGFHFLSDREGSSKSVISLPSTQQGALLCGEAWYTPTFKVEAAQAWVGNALCVLDAVVGEAGNLQVGQLCETGAGQPIPIHLQPQKVGEAVQRRQISQLVL